ncbi:MAG: MATE family efflux transporter [Lachnospiraceae bacterium]|nr:MATE family efflux transporter [Lachnospiraceae bacterium]
MADHDKTSKTNTGETPVRPKIQAGVDFLNGNIPKEMLKFALPILASVLFQSFYHTIDTVIVGHVLGETQLAAIGAASPFYNLLIGIALGMGSGMAIVAGRSYGKGDRDLIKRSVATAIKIAACMAVLVTVIAQLTYRPVLHLLRTPVEAYGGAADYISVITLFAVVTVAFNLCSGLLSAIGNSLMPMVFLIIANGINIVLDILFVAGFGMGIRGAALATIISQLIAAIVSLFYISRKCRILIPEKASFKRDVALYKEMLQQGLASSLMNSLVALGTLTLQGGINTLGYLYIAGHTTARKVYEYTIMFNMSISQTLIAFCSQNKGAGNWNRIRKGRRYGIFFNFCMVVILTCIMAFAAPTLIRLVSGSNDPIVVENGARYLRFTTPCVMILATMNCTRMPLLAIGNKIVPVVAGLVEFVWKVIFVIFMIPRYGYNAVIVAEPLIWVCMLIWLLLCYYRIDELKPQKEDAILPEIFGRRS